MLTPQELRLQPQGWKIHVSGTPANAERVLTAVADYCVDAHISFKHLVYPAVVLLRNSKNAPRPASGKLVTIYPSDDVEFERILVELSEILAGESGPYILSDLRIGDGPLYVRYGGFLMRWAEVDGRRVPVVQRPDGSLVSDERRPGFPTRSSIQCTTLTEAGSTSPTSMGTTRTWWCSRKHVPTPGSIERVSTP